MVLFDPDHVLNGMFRDPTVAKNQVKNKIRELCAEAPQAKPAYLPKMVFLIRKRRRQDVFGVIRRTILERGAVPPVSSPGRVATRIDARSSSLWKTSQRQMRERCEPDTLRS